MEAIKEAIEYFHKGGLVMWPDVYKRQIKYFVNQVTLVLIEKLGVNPTRSRRCNGE